ncbi:MAG: trypsin-like peptidase domain-containing protein [Halobacteriovoraceae bacterium]|jgi:V8-like Glu-specific endopeptidase|nr:trypsin-like peptidase domain-containing protein [Halobacteriovoraceae bacterium]
MKIVLLVLLSFPIPAFAAQKVIYGEDNRVDYYLVSKSHQEIADATAVMINNIRIKEKKDHFLLSKKTLRNYGVCEGERFLEQFTAGSCSGFLIAPDLLATAGHCIQTVDDCKLIKWVFDYKLLNRSPMSRKVLKKSVYNCVELVERGFSQSKAIDYSIVKLDRAISDRKILKLRRSGKVNNNANLAVFGYPTGLPLKVAKGGKVRRNGAKHFFVTNLDTFGGNSGSPVVDLKSLEVEGILIRGEDDYITDTRQDCKRVKQCSPNSCEGETVTRITNIKL